MNDSPQSWLELWPSLAGQTLEEVGIGSLVIVMVVSLACSFFASFLYLAFYGSRPTGSQIHRAFPLLGISITAVFVCIQFSLPLSLGLLGALSIVRFRTPIKEPEEIGFIMFLVSTSIACATFNFVFLAVILGVGVVALVVRRFGPSLLRDPQQDGVVVISLAGAVDPERQGRVLELLDARLRRGRVESISATGERTEISYAFTGVRGTTLPELQSDLARELGGAAIQVFFHRPAGL